MGICLILGGSKPLPLDGLGHLFRENGKKNGKNVKSRLKKVPQGARLSAGGGGNCYLGNAHIEVETN